MIRKLLDIPPKYAVAIQVAILIISFGVVAIVANTPKPEIKVYPQIQTVVHLQPMPDFIGKAPVKQIKKTYSQKERLGPKQLKSVLHSAGFRGKKLQEAWAIAMKESTGRPAAHNKNSATGDNSYGLFQINMINSLGPARREMFNLKTNKDLLDPLRNAEIAYSMSNGGKNWSAWNGITDKTIYWMSKFPDKS
jgi:hypothetical protein